DQLLNFLGYLPLGLLAMLALRRRGLAWGLCLTGALSFAALLSYVSEVLQHLLPGRHPSLKDWAFNLLGAACG
ncbi:MAG TPA: VanZ family protein, partial [Rubrivivax sp.]|nr:VanZ family protein [Rubrivivax sp.]